VQRPTGKAYTGTGNFGGKLEPGECRGTALDRGSPRRHQVRRAARGSARFHIRMPTSCSTSSACSIDGEPVGTTAGVRVATPGRFDVAPLLPATPVLRALLPPFYGISMADELARRVSRPREGSARARAGTRQAQKAGRSRASALATALIALADPRR
jgi:hypothetical protein